jgi:hypothetical protein
MEISPITGVRALPVVKAPPIESELPAVFDVEHTATIGDETYTPSREKSASGAEDDELDDETENLADVDEADSVEPVQQPSTGRAISFFA